MMSGAVEQTWRRFVHDVSTNPLARRGVILAVLVLVFDQLTKWIILGPLAFSPEGCLARFMGDDTAPFTCRHIEISPFFDLTMVWNTGVSFGMFSAETWVGRAFLIVFAGAVAVGLTVWLSRSVRPFTALALSLVIGGSIGNIIDRVRFGAVVDFFNFAGGTPANPGGGWFGWALPADFPPLSWIDNAILNGDGQVGIGFPYVFNIADAAISIGVVILLVDWAMEERRQKAAQAPSA